MENKYLHKCLCWTLKSMGDRTAEKGFFQLMHLKLCFASLTTKHKGCELYTVDESGTHAEV